MVPIRKYGTRAVHFCITHCRLNKDTHADPFQMPLIQELLDNYAGVTWLTKVGMKKEIYQVPLDKDGDNKTALCSPWGKYQFKGMPFGLMNAPATFQRCMNETLSKHFEYSSTYIDDDFV